MRKIITHLVLPVVLLLAVSFVTCSAQEKEIDRVSIITGKDIAVAHTRSGKVQGYIRNGTYTYKGIPYAKALRFMPPVQPDSWEGTRSCLSWGPVCPQNSEGWATVNDSLKFMLPHDGGYMGENCLCLNIWTPSVKDRKKRPVMVWIHGGWYLVGSSQDLDFYDGEQLSKKGDLVIVSVNHRLNVLGFANLSSFGEKYKASANLGIMDLVAALSWIKDNISNFGGDPDNVTLFGQSGGGGKIAALLCAPSARELFHKAIIQSGVSPRFQKNEITQRIGKALVSELGLPAKDIHAIEKIPYGELAAAGEKAVEKVRQELIKEGNPPQGYEFGFSPTIDGDFLPYAPSDKRSLGLSSNIPLIIGSSKNETLPSQWSDPPLEDLSSKAIHAHIVKKYGDKAQAYIAAVKKAYPWDTDPVDLIDVDTSFRHTVIRQANLHSENSNQPVFLYLFTWQSPVLDGRYKAMHCMELPFVFNNIDLGAAMTGGGKEARILEDKMSRAWINFARFGNPNHKDLPLWPEYTQAKGGTMFFDNNCKVYYRHDADLLNITKDVP